MNRHDTNAVHDLVFGSCVLAVREYFPHLSAADIITPPHQWFDAALARQIVIHLMVRVFDIPKRRVVDMQCRSREAVNRALRTIDERLEGQFFSAAYSSMAERAQSLFAIDYEKAA